MREGALAVYEFKSKVFVVYLFPMLLANLEEFVNTEGHFC